MRSDASCGHSHSTAALTARPHKQDSSHVVFLVYCTVGVGHRPDALPLGTNAGTSRLNSRKLRSVSSLHFRRHAIPRVLPALARSSPEGEGTMCTCSALHYYRWCSSPFHLLFPAPCSERATSSCNCCLLHLRLNSAVARLMCLQLCHGRTEAANASPLFLTLAIYCTE